MAKPTYEDYYELSAEVVLTAAMLGGFPYDGSEDLAPLEGADGDQVFERVDGLITIMAKCLRAGIRDALRMMNVESKQAWRHFRCTNTAVPEGDIADRSWYSLPCPPQFEGGSGTGIANFEALAPGTKLCFCVAVPGTVVPQDEAMEFMRQVGLYGRVSPAKAKHGYGAFEVVSLRVDGDPVVGGDDESADA